MEQKADNVQSRSIGQLLTLEELPKFLSAIIKDLENTKHYKLHGYVWFYLSTIGTDMHGRYKFNPEGKTLHERFEPVSRTKYNNLDFSERAYFYRGSQPLRVYLRRDPLVNDWRLAIVGYGGPPPEAKVVVVKQSEPSQTNSEADTPQNVSGVAPIPEGLIGAAERKLLELERNTGEAIPEFRELVQAAKNQRRT